MEDNGDKGYSARDLNDAGIKTKTYHESMNKHLKIATFLYANWSRVQWLDPNLPGGLGTDPMYLEQIYDYREGIEPDDAPDSGASLIRIIEPSESTTLSLVKKLYGLTPPRS